MKIASSILAAMMAFMLMSVSCTDETPDFVVPGPGTGQTNNGGNSSVHETLMSMNAIIAAKILDAIFI